MAQKGIIKSSTSADVRATDLASIFHGILGSSGILNAYSLLACTKIDNNTVQLAAGVYSLSGYLLQVEMGTTQNLSVDSGTAGYNRIDLVCAEFVRNGGGAGIDTLQFRVIKGSATTGTPSEPTLTQQDINGTGTTRQEALWKLTLAGTTLSATITAKATYINKMSSGFPEIRGRATFVWNPVSLAADAGESYTGITVTGAQLGDIVLVGPGISLQGMIATGYVATTDSVSVRLQNVTTGTLDLASSTWTVTVLKGS